MINLSASKIVCFSPILPAVQIPDKRNGYSDFHLLIYWQSRSAECFPKKADEQFQCLKTDAQLLQDPVSGIAVRLLMILQIHVDRI